MLINLMVQHLSSKLLHPTIQLHELPRIQQLEIWTHATKQIHEGERYAVSFSASLTVLQILMIW